MTLQAHPSSQLCKALTFPDTSGSSYSLLNARLVVWALPSKGVGFSSRAWKTHKHSTVLSPPVLGCSSESLTSAAALLWPL